MGGETGVGMYHSRKNHGFSLPRLLLPADLGPRCFTAWPTPRNGADDPA
jgi:hypothetical protein